jgi:CRP-like cAMP-binding protein
MGPRYHAYTISFSVADSSLLTPTKNQLLRLARRQLYFAGLLSQDQKGLPRPRRPLPVRQVLSELALLETLESEVIDSLAQKVVTRLLEPGEVILSQGDTRCALYVIASGVVEVSKEVEAGVLKLGRLGAGEYVGEMALLTGASYAATARTLTHCQVYEITRDAITSLFSAHPGLMAAFDQSARRGMELVNRSVAARASEAVKNPGLLLDRIRNFFHFQAPN